jgi:hypothetical protein
VVEVDVSILSRILAYDPGWHETSSRRPTRDRSFVRISERVARSSLAFPVVLLIERPDEPKVERRKGLLLGSVVAVETHRLGRPFEFVVRVEIWRREDGLWSIDGRGEVQIER